MTTSVTNKNLKRIQKYPNKKQRRGWRRQRGRFLDRYDFVYAGWDTVNRALKGLDSLPSKLIGQALKEINKINEGRIRQVINKGRQQIQKIAPQIIRRAIEDVYKTLFRLLGKLGKLTFLQLKRNLSKIFLEMIDGKTTDKISHGCATRYSNSKKKHYLTLKKANDV